ncbi:MAG: hypothetical protein HYW08_07000, partial [candidate division NC10 bacterium]|nr:hypothetical protein [candidate division NC10 bacterium]
MITRRQFVTAAIGLAAGSCLDLPVARPASWRRGADAPTRRSEVAAAVLGEAIYVVGGFGGAGGLVEAYHPLANRWERRTTLPLGLHHTAVVAMNDYLFVVGGYRDGWIASDAVLAYDAGADRWQARRPMPTARGALAAAGHAGKIFAFGGAAARAFRKSAGTLGSGSSATGAISSVTTSPASNPGARPPAASRSGIGAAALRGRIYVVGGEAPEGTFSQVEIFDPVSNRWSRGPDLPTPRHGLGVVAFQGRLYVLAGGPTPGGSAS